MDSLFKCISADSTDEDRSDDDFVEAVAVVKKVTRPQGRFVLKIFYSQLFVVGILL